MAQRNQPQRPTTRSTSGRQWSAARTNVRRKRRGRAPLPWGWLVVGIVFVGLLAAGLWRVSSERPAGVQATAEATLVASTSPPKADAREHRWMGRPLARNVARDFADRTYLFGSSKNNAYRIHHGLDMVNPTGTPVQAAADGIIVFAGRDPGTRFGPKTIPDFYGNVVIVKLSRQFRGKDVYYINGHLNEVLVREGQQVKEGDQLGKIGMTGTADGPHLHFEVRVGGNTYADSRNAGLWLRHLPATGGLAGKVTDRSGKVLGGVALTLLKDMTPSGVQKYWGDVYTYQDDPLGKLNADEEWNENFAVGDLPVGRYEVRANIGGQTYLRHVTILDGQTTWLEIQEGSTIEL